MRFLSGKRRFGHAIYAGVVMAVLALVLAGVWVFIATRPPTDLAAEDVWFDDIQRDLTLTDEEQVAVIQFVTAALMDVEVDADLPAAVLRDRWPRIVFLSISDGHTPARVVMARGIGLADALDRALSESEEALADGYPARWIKVDIVQEVIALGNIDFAQPLNHERSLYGLAFDERLGVAFLPEELMARRLVEVVENEDGDDEQWIQLKQMDAYLADRAVYGERLYTPSDPSAVMTYRFSTWGVFSDGSQILPLYRGHRTFDQITPDDLLEAALAGGDYLTQAVDENGRFDYLYQPEDDYVPPGYNIVRHAGTVYAMAELYEVYPDAQLLAATERAIGYLINALRDCPVDGDETARCVVMAGHTDLGANALGLVALAEYTQVTGDRQYMPIMRDLARWIVYAQDESGEFTIHRQSYPSGMVQEDYECSYYPGESMLGLLRLYAIDPDETWLDAAEAAAIYLIEVRDAGLTNYQLPHDHWLLYALNDLYRWRPEEIYLDHEMRIANTVIHSQNRRSDYEDMIGSYGRSGNVTPAATRSEGLNAAYQLAHDFGHMNQAAEILEAIQRGVTFQLQVQFRPESVMYFPDPQQALGGFHVSLTGYEIRNDYVQHNLSAILGLRRILIEVEEE